jgi:hypothetical protein
MLRCSSDNKGHPIAAGVKKPTSTPALVAPCRQRRWERQCKISRA